MLTHLKKKTTTLSQQPVSKLRYKSSKRNTHLKVQQQKGNTATLPHNSFNCGGQHSSFSPYLFAEPQESNWIGLSPQAASPIYAAGPERTNNRLQGLEARSGPERKISTLSACLLCSSHRTMISPVMTTVTITASFRDIFRTTFWLHTPNFFTIYFKLSSREKSGPQRKRAQPTEEREDREEEKGRKGTKEQAGVQKSCESIQRA